LPCVWVNPSLQSACITKPTPQPTHFGNEEECNVLFRKHDLHLQDYVASQSRSPKSLQSSPCERQNLRE
jgi:hypothetical protein